MPRFENHAVCHVFPPMSPEDRSELKKDIEANYVQTAVVLWRNPEQGSKAVIVDGFHRAAICEELGGEYLDYPTREYKGTAEEMVRHITSLNLHRRHLTSGQRAAAFVKADGMATEYRTAGGRAGRPANSADGDGHEPRGRAAEAAAVAAQTSTTQINRAVQLQKLAPEKLDEVIAGTTTLAKGLADVKRSHRDTVSGEAVEPQEPTLEQRAKAWSDLLEESAKEAIAVGNNLPDGLDETTLGIIRDQLKSVVSTIRAQRGVAPCSYCGGKACPKCNELGWLNRSKHESAPKNMKVIPFGRI